MPINPALKAIRNSTLKTTMNSSGAVRSGAAR
jgi:hypothetical protein